jgi:RNA polymerase sigma-B factor
MPEPVDLFDWQRRRTDQRLRHRGDASARAELTQRYLPLARSLAGRYRDRGEPMDDLMQVASLGLVKAVERWEPDRGLEFSSFAVPTILGELRRHFRDHAWMIRPPRPTQELFLLVAKARRALEAELSRAPSLDEIAAYLDRSYEHVLDAVEAASAHTPRSLEEPRFADAPETEPSDGPAVAEAGYARVEDRVLLDTLMRSLSKRAREILRLRFDEDLKQREIAERMGYSQIHVSRIVRDALETMQALADPHASAEPASPRLLAA